MAYYAIRYTSSIHADLKRGWSAYMGTWGDLAHALDCVEDQRRDGEAYREFVRRMRKEGIIRRAGTKWGVFHHEGLSCYALAATSPDAAIAEARARYAETKGGAEGTGQIIYPAGVVAQIADDCYLLVSEQPTQEEN